MWKNLLLLCNIFYIVIGLSRATRVCVCVCGSGFAIVTKLFCKMLLVSFFFPRFCQWDFFRSLFIHQVTFVLCSVVPAKSQRWIEQKCSHLWISVECINVPWRLKAITRLENKSHFEIQPLQFRTMGFCTLSTQSASTWNSRSSMLSKDVNNYSTRNSKFG